MNRILAVNCTPILDCSKNDPKTAVEAASDAMVMGVVQAFGEFSLLVSQQIHCDVTLRSLDDALR
jgi:DNA-binding LacI/PurR family transcriptional regulator